MAVTVKTRKPELYLDGFEIRTKRIGRDISAEELLESQAKRMRRMFRLD